MELINLPIVRGLEKDTHLYNILLEIDKRDGVVCGGFARYCAADKIIENEDFDVDIYPSDQNSYEIITGYLLTNRKKINWYGQFREGSPKYLTAKNVYSGRLLTSINLSPMREWTKLQIIGMFGAPEEIINTFDFSICQAYLDLKNFCIKVVPNFIKSEQNRVIELTNLQIPEVKEYKNGNMFLHRFSKYKEKGYRIPAEVIIESLKGVESEHWGSYLKNISNYIDENDNKRFIQFIGNLQHL